MINLDTDLIKQHDKVRKVSRSKKWWLYYKMFVRLCVFEIRLLQLIFVIERHRLITVNWSKQKALDADPRAIQQIVFETVVGGAGNTKIRLYAILEKWKETVLEFQKGTGKVLRMV